jgi:hypothetical protein
MHDDCKPCFVSPMGHLLKVRVHETTRPLGSDQVQFTRTEVLASAQGHAHIARALWAAKDDSFHGILVVLYSAGGKA